MSEYSRHASACQASRQKARSASPGQRSRVRRGSLWADQRRCRQCALPATLPPATGWA